MALNDIIVPKEAVVGVLSEVVLTPAEIGASASEPADDIFRVVGSADPTKKVAFEVDGLTTATTRTLTAPDASGTIARTEDFAAPPAIGSTTPNSAAFTSLSANNGTLTASAPVLDLSQTWNNAGVTFTGLRVNVTNTASGSSSLLADFQVNGTSVLEVNSRGLTKVRKVSNITEYVNIFEVFKASSSFFQIRDDGNYTFPSVKGGALATYKTVAKSGGFFLASGGQLGWTSSATDGYNIATDLSIVRDAADTLAQRRDANPQTFRLYNTYTDASNYERGFMRWDSNNFDIGCEADGTGTLRNVRIKTDATSGVSGTGYIEFGGSSIINTIKSVGGTANGALYIYSQSTLRMLIGGSSGTQFYQLIFPSGNGALDIGRTGNRWRDVFCRSVDLTGDLILTTATGTKIGTATTQKLGFFNATPVVQQAAIADATDAATAITQLNDLLAAMRTLGLIAT
jgi:hypothetical protein